MAAPRKKRAILIDSYPVCHTLTDYRTIVEYFYKVVEFVEWLKNTTLISFISYIKNIVIFCAMSRRVLFVWEIFSKFVVLFGYSSRHIESVFVNPHKEI
jgi:ABC-type maltose transport system permease subunit